MATEMCEEAEVPVWDEVHQLLSITDLKGDDGGGHSCKETEVPVWEEVHQLCSVTDLKYKDNDGGSHGCGG